MLDVRDRRVRSALRGYVSDVAGCSPDRITAVSRFSDGNRHAVYLVSLLDDVHATQDMIVRVSFDRGPAECGQVEREASVLEKVGGIAAPLLYDVRLTSSWFDAPTMCMQFLPGSPQELGSAAPGDVERLGSVVAAVHGQFTDGLAQSLGTSADLATYASGRLESILSGLTWVRTPLPALVRDRLRGAAESLQSRWGSRRDSDSFTSAEPLALLHGDIGPGNVLWSPDPVLIDWEYTRLGDPADEIAYLFDQNGLATPQREAFWRGYRDSTNSRTRFADVTDRVDWWERLTLFGSTLWWVERWVRRSEADAAGTADPAVPRQQGYYADHVIRRLDRLGNLLA